VLHLDSLWIDLLGDTDCFHSSSLCREDKHATVPYLGQKVKNQVGCGMHLATKLGLPLGPEGQLHPQSQHLCNSRSKAELGGIQSWVSCIFKTAFEGAYASQSFHVRETACEKGRGGERLSLGGGCQGLCLMKPVASFTAGLLPFENQLARNPQPLYHRPVTSHFTALRKGDPVPMLCHSGFVSLCLRHPVFLDKPSL
jgi:hypothetical protein